MADRAGIQQREAQSRRQGAVQSGNAICIEVVFHVSLAVPEDSDQFDVTQGYVGAVGQPPAPRPVHGWLDVAVHHAGTTRLLGGQGCLRGFLYAQQVDQARRIVDVEQDRTIASIIVAIPVEDGEIADRIRRFGQHRDAEGGGIDVIQIAAQSDVARIPVALVVAAREANGKAIRDHRQREGAFELLVVEVAVVGLEIAFPFVSGRRRIVEYRTARRVAAEQRPLRPFQHLDGGHVVSPHPAAECGLRHIGEIADDGERVRAAQRFGLDPDLEHRVFPASRSGQVDARRLEHEVRRTLDIGQTQHLFVERGDRHRRRLDILPCAPGGHDDIVVSHFPGGGVGGLVRPRQGIGRYSRHQHGQTKQKRAITQGADMTGSLAHEAVPPPELRWQALAVPSLPAVRLEDGTIGTAMPSLQTGSPSLRGGHALPLDGCPSPGNQPRSDTLARWC